MSACIPEQKSCPRHGRGTTSSFQRRSSWQQFPFHMIGWGLSGHPAALPFDDAPFRLLLKVVGIAAILTALEWQTLLVSQLYASPLLIAGEGPADSISAAFVMSTILLWSWRLPGSYSTGRSVLQTVQVGRCGSSSGASVQESTTPESLLGCFHD